MKTSRPCTAAPSRSTGRKRFGTSACLRSRPRKMRLSLPVRCVSKAIGKPGSWQNKSRKPAVPLSKIQTDILRLLAAHRDPDSYVAGASALNRDAPRYYPATSMFFTPARNALPQPLPAMHKRLRRQVTASDGSGANQQYIQPKSPGRLALLILNGLWIASFAFSRL